MSIISLVDSSKLGHNDNERRAWGNVSRLSREKEAGVNAVRDDLEAVERLDSRQRSERWSCGRYFLEIREVLDGRRGERDEVQRPISLNRRYTRVMAFLNIQKWVSELQMRLRHGMYFKVYCTRLVLVCNFFCYFGVSCCNKVTTDMDWIHWRKCSVKADSNDK